MEATAKAVVAVRHSEPPLLSESVEPQFSAVFYDVTQQAQAAMESMLKMISELDESSAGIMDEIEKCKEQAVERNKMLEEEKERFQKAAFSVLEMLNSNEIC